MKLGYLAKSIEIEGDVCLAVFDDGGVEVERVYLEYIDNLATEKEAQRLKNKTVKYMFTAGDYLIIELKEG